MVEIKQFTESKFISVPVVKDSKNKILVIMGEGAIVDNEFQGRAYQCLQLPVELDLMQKMWQPSKDAMKSMKEAWGSNTIGWIGKKVRVSIMTLNGKEVIVAQPIYDMGQ